MAVSIVTYTGDGSTSQYIITFDYIARTHVSATVGGTAASFTFINDTTIQFNTAPASAAEVKLVRQTPVAALVDFTDGSTLFEADLDLAHRQNRLLAEESRDRADNAIITLNNNITNINTAAASDVAINTVAAGIANVNNVATNMAEVLLADTNAATATTKASEASASAATASQQATISTTKAGEASGSAAAALVSKNAASGSAGEALASKNEATTQAGLATTNGAAQVSLAAGQVALATTQVGLATTQVGLATTKANNAATSASTATTQAGTATTQAGTATTQAGISTTKAGEASTSASTATTKAGEASTSASASASSATASADSAAAAAAAFDSFDDKYLGSKTGYAGNGTGPTVDNDGNALVEGALFFSSEANEMRVYDGANWIAASSAGTASLILYEFTATNAQTTFTGSDDNSATLGYTAGNLQVVMNGVILDPSDFTASNGTSVVLGSGATTGDLLNVYAFKSFTVADTVSASAGGTFQGNVNFGASANFGDNDRLNFGAGADLQIFHNGSNSYVRDNGTGILILQGASGVHIQGRNATDMIRANEDSSVDLYFDDVVKLATTSTGITVSGKLGIDNTSATALLSVGGSGTALGTTGGNNINLMTLQAVTSNNDLLVFTSERLTTGTDWTSAAQRIQRKIDASPMGYMQFGNRDSDLITFGENATEYMRIDGDGKVGIGTDNPSYKLHVSAGAGNGIFVEDDNINGGSPSIKVLGKRTDGNASQAFSGKLLLSGVRGGGKALNGKHLGTLAFGGNHTSGATANVLYPASISGIAEGDFNSAADMPAGLVFYTGSAGAVEGGGAAGTMGTEAMRIDSSGNLLVGKTAESGGTAGHFFSSSGYARATRNGSMSLLNRLTSDGSAIDFQKNGTGVGSISVTGSATAFNTSSDYRLKENITPVQGAADVVMAMQPCTYTAISDGLWYDGFLAHELQEIHPRAVQGTKDAMKDEEYEITPAVYEDVVAPAVETVEATYDEDGLELTEATEGTPETINSVLVTAAVMGTRSVPDMQSVDYSKLTPIITAALQEALAKIESMETRLTALEG